MQRHGQLIGIEQKHIETYKAYHAAVWPEVSSMITVCNITNYSIFQFGELLFAYFEYTGDDFDADMERMAQDETTQRWWAIQKPLQSPLPDRGEGQWWAEMVEVFHMD
jgi:L-rhamnose mutarotase